MRFTGHNALMIAAVFIMLGALATCAHAHDWYPTECCQGSEAGGDCYPIKATDLQEEPGGCFKYLPTGNMFCGDQVRLSEDSNWHVCIGNQPYNQGRSYCAFIHRRSF